MPKKKNKHTTVQRTSAEYGQFRSLRIAGILLYLLLIFVFSGTFWFLYKNMYQTIGQIISLSDLEQVTATERVDTVSLDTVLELLTLKEGYVPPVVVRDPFSPVILDVEVPINDDL